MSVYMVATNHLHHGSYDFLRDVASLCGPYSMFQLLGQTSIGAASAFRAPSGSFRISGALLQSGLSGLVLAHLFQMVGSTPS